jgi:hypothetical protein
MAVALLKAIKARAIPFVVTLHDYWWICANAQLLTNYNPQICAGPEAYVNCARCALARSGVPHLWPAIPPLSGLLSWRSRLLREFCWQRDPLLPKPLRPYLVCCPGACAR